MLRRSGAPASAVAVVDGAESWTYRELADHVEQRAVELVGRAEMPGHDADPSLGLTPVVLEPDAKSVVELLAHWRAGAIPVPLNARLTEAEADAARAALAGVEPPEGTRVVLWTSGTSGRPRGVALSWSHLEASVRGAARHLSLTERDAWLSTLSPAHVGGLVAIVRSLLLGGTLSMAGSFDVERISSRLDGADEGGVEPTHVSLVPTQLLRLLEHRGDRPPPPALRMVLLGGAHAPRSLVQRAQATGWPLAITYGATEMTSQIATAPPSLSARKPGTVGSPLPGVELRIADDGEILAGGETRALGYVGAGAGDLADESGWYHTGDMGRIDDEGHLWVTGRRIDRIVSGGVTIDAVEVEEQLRSHPSVIDACVVGIPDEEWGDRVAAWIEPVEGEFDLDDVDRFVAGKLSGAKRPRAWHVSPGMPRNVNGKVDRARVRETLQERR